MSTKINQCTENSYPEGFTSDLQMCAKRVAGHIAKPMDICDIVSNIESDEYNAELMLQHLLLWSAKTERHLKDPHCVRAMVLLGTIVLPDVISALVGNATPASSTAPNMLASCPASHPLSEAPPADTLL